MPLPIALIGQGDPEPIADVALGNEQLDPELGGALSADAWIAHGLQIVVFVDKGEIRLFRQRAGWDAVEHHMLAAVGAGAHNDVVAAADAMVTVTTRVEPNGDDYAGLRASWNSLYRDLAPTMHRLADQSTIR